MATVCRFAIFSSWVLGRGPKERTKNLQAAVRSRWWSCNQYSYMYKTTAENRFKKGGFFCALVHATLCRFAIFSSWVWEVGRKEGTKNLQGTAWSRWCSCNRYCTKKRSKITFNKCFFFVHWRMAAVCRFATFSYWIRGRVPRNAQKIYRGCAVQMVKLYFRHCTKKRTKIILFLWGFSCAHGHSMPVCNFFLMDLGKGSQGTHKKLTGAAWSRGWSCIFVIVR